MRCRQSVSKASRRNSSIFSLNSMRWIWPGADDLAGAQAADEHVAFPFRQAVAGVERQARNRDRRHPVDDRIDEAVALELLRVPRALVRASQAHERPAVVAAGTRMLISSPPFGPFSLCQICPVPGCTASPSVVRWPSVKISGRYPSRPTNGLSFGTLPSSLSRRTCLRACSDLARRRPPSTCRSCRRGRRSCATRVPESGCVDEQVA